MTHDIVIRGGLIADGTGKAAFRGDLAIDGALITAVGPKVGRGAQEIDAEGLIVTPGFIDLHTHLDAQVGWDPLLRPLSWHGVTTALMGNCGVTFAPCRRTDHALLAEMMASVEDIPKDAILGGLSWQWETYGEYLDAVANMRPAINLAGLVGHSAVRFYVMGERAVSDQPNATEVDAIARLVRESVRDGAFGCSINRLRGHAMPDGRDIPGTHAETQELLAIAHAVAAHGGFIQTIPDFPKLESELELMLAMGRITGRLLWSAPVAWSSEAVAWVGRWMQRMRAAGIAVTGLSSPRSGGLISGISAEVFLHERPRRTSWKSLKAMTFEQRMAAINDPQFAAKLVADGESIEGWQDWARLTFPLGEGPAPDWMPPPERSLAAQASARDMSPIALWLETMRTSDGKALFFTRQHNRNLPIMRELLQCDWVLPGLGDAGAHCAKSMDSGFPTLMLTRWVRDEPLFTLEEAVHRLSGRAAAMLGLADRGIIAVGQRADINVIDLAALAERMPEMLHEFPGGAPHLSERAVGYRATLCNGAVVIRDDEHTGARPGTVLRSSGAGAR